MANKPLKSIKFPGLSDTYTVPEVDDTLAVTGAAADAKKIGDEISDLKADLSEAVTEIAMAVTKQEIPPVPPTEITQVVDLSNATNSGSGTEWKWTGFIIPIYWLGKYYINPIGDGYNLLNAYPYNKNGELLTIYRNGSSHSPGLNIAANGYMDVIDKRTIKTYNSSGGLSWTWTTDDDIAYFAGKTGVSIKLGYSTTQSAKIGMTFLMSSENYVEYTPLTPGETEYEYVYNDEMSEHVADYITDNLTDNEPTEGSNNFVKSGGIVTSLLKKTYNLVDPEWFLWDSGAAYIDIPTDMYLDAIPGKVLLSNASKVLYTFYDASKTRLSSESSTIVYAPVVVPSGAVYFKPAINSAAFIPENHEVVIYYSDNTTSPRDDIKPYILHNNLIGMRGSNEIFDYYAPNTLDKEILQMAKYTANRNMNYCNNTVRIGTFNMYLARTTYGWETAKKMFKDYAVDIAGFQEVTNTNGRVWTEFLKSWEFPYGVTDDPVAVASQFEILSHQTYTTSVTERKFIKTVIQLPRYADRIDPLLSIYDYHGIWDGGTYEKRAQEIADVQAIMADDTSHFIVVLGDTNAPAPHSEWDLWRNAGYTPVNTGNLATTINGGSLDNIFIPQNVTCKNVHVVPSRNYTITISGNVVPLSDHNMLFADLQFDFDSLLV